MSDESVLGKLDRLGNTDVLQGRSWWWGGVIGSLGLIAALVEIYLSSVISYLQGNYYQSSFWTVGQPFQQFASYDDERMALVFYNRTTGLVVNHTQLFTSLRLSSFRSNYMGTLLSYESLTSCDLALFQNAVNPITLTDCFTVGRNQQFQMGKFYHIAASYGFYITYFCSSPFFCKSGNSYFTTNQNNWASYFSAFNYRFFFTSKVITPSGSTQFQVHQVDSTDFSTPYTITGTFDAETYIKNTTVDSSIFPWWNNQTQSNIVWDGVVRGTAKNSSSLITSSFKLDIIGTSSIVYAYRYYKKLDWLLGIIGGGMCLIYILIWIPCNYISKTLMKARIAEELILIAPEGLPLYITDIKKLQISWTYVVCNLLPFCSCLQQVKAVERSQRMLDIANMIKKVRVAKRNLLKDHAEFPQILRKIVFPELEEISQKKKLLENLQLSQNSFNQRQNLRKNSEQKVEIGLQQDRKNQSKIDMEMEVSEERVPSVKVQQRIQEDKNQQKVEMNIQEDRDPMAIVELEKKQGNKQKQKFEKVEQYLIVDQRQEIKHHSGDSQQGNVYLSMNILNANSFPELLQIQMRQSEENRKKELIELLNVHPDALEAVKNSHEAKQIYETNGIIMLTLQDGEKFQKIQQDQCYEKYQAVAPRANWFNKFKDYSLSLFEELDIFGATPNFNANRINVSFWGCLVTIAIITLAVITFALTIGNASTPRVFISDEYQTPDMINYQVVTGPGFRPAVCFGPNNVSQLSGVSQLASLSFFYYTASGGKQYVPAVNMQSGQYNLLNIPPGSLYSQIDTSLCFIMPDGISITLGGLGTPNEGYFGFTLTPYCAGTVAACKSAINSTNNNFITFLNSAQPLLYLPSNQYDPGSNSLYGAGGVVMQALKVGTSSNQFLVAGAQETVLVDECKLLAPTSYSQITGSGDVLQNNICTDRFLPNSYVRGVPNTTLYYECHVRPSGNLRNFIIQQYGVYYVLGVIGGCFFLYYAALHLLGLIYNAFNVRAKLAEQIYNQESYENSAASKCYHIWNLPICLLPRCGDCRNSVHRMRLVDQKIKKELDIVQLTKEVDNCYKISGSFFKPFQAKQMSLIYFKQRVNQQETVMPIVNMDDRREEQDYFSEEVVEKNDEEQSGQSVKISNEVKKEQKLGITVDQLAAEEQRILDDVTIAVSPYHKYETYNPPSSLQKFVSALDWFQPQNGLTLDGKRQIKSIFGACMFVVTVAFVLFLFLNYVIVYSQRLDYVVSYEKSVIYDPTKDVIWTFNNSNFRFALGFYEKPNCTFINVSSYVNNSNASAPVEIAVYQTTLVQTSQGFYNTTVTKTDLVSCPSNYLSGFTMPNIQQSYFANINYGFCLPSNLTLYLTGLTNLSFIQYFTISIANKTNLTNSTSGLKSLTGSYPAAFYMSSSQVNIKQKTFNYTTKMIRMNSEVLTKAYQYNVTLNRQDMIFDDSNNQLSNPPPVSNYFYNQNRANEFTYQPPNTSLPQTYNITFCYNSVLDLYTISYTKIAELFGFAGGIIAIFIAFFSFVAGSFNKYKLKFLIGQKLYIFWRTKASQVKHNSKKNRKHVKQPTSIEEINSYSEWRLFFTWVLSLVGDILNQYDWNQNLRRTTLIIKRVEKDTNLFEFYNQLVEVKEGINKSVKLSANPQVPVASFYPKQLLKNSKLQYTHENQFIAKQARRHNLSSFEQMKIFRAQEAKINLQEIFDKEYISKAMNSGNENSAIDMSLGLLRLQAPQQGQQQPRLEKMESQEDMVNNSKSSSQQSRQRNKQNRRRKRQNNPMNKDSGQKDLDKELLPQASKLMEEEKKVRKEDSDGQDEEGVKRQELQHQIGSFNVQTVELSSLDDGSDQNSEA